MNYKIGTYKRMGKENVGKYKIAYIFPTLYRSNLIVK